jgi:hypothetical protein
VRLVRLRGGGAHELAERSARGCGVMVVPLTMFDAGDEHIRLGLGRRGFPPRSTRWSGSCHLLDGINAAAFSSRPSPPPETPHRATSCYAGNLA